MTGPAPRPSGTLARIFVTAQLIATSRKLTRRPSTRVKGTIGWPRITARCIAPPVYPDTQVGANRAKPFGRSNSSADDRPLAVNVLFGRWSARSRGQERNAW
jgi:hypothetical protein